MKLPGAGDRRVRLKTAIVNVIWENGQFGSIVWKQDKKFGRHFGVDSADRLRQLAEAFGRAGVALAPTPMSSRSG